MKQSLTAQANRWFVAIACVLVAVILTMPSLAKAAPSDDLQAEADALADSAAGKQAEAEEALAQLNAMQETLDRLSAEYGQAVAEQEQAEANRDAAQKRINEISAEIADIQDRLGARARDMYRNGNITYLEVLFGSASFEEFTTNLELLNRVNEADADLIAKQKELRIEAERQKAVYAEQAAIAEQKAKEAQEAAEQAAATVEEMQAIYDGLSAEAAELLEEQRQAQAAADEARAQEIMEQAAREAAAARAAGGDSDDIDYDFSNDEAIDEDTAYEGGYDTVSRAYACLGAPYVWGGVGPYGYDCSGLVSYCLTGDHSRLGTTYTFMGWEQVSDPQPGDICTNWSHCGIYIGGGQMIHAADYGIGVIIGPVQSGMIIVRY